MILFQPHVFLPEMSAATLSVRPNRLSSGSCFPLPPDQRIGRAHLRKPWRGITTPLWRTFRILPTPVQAGSRADDSVPFDMSVENALKLLGVSDGASFEDILRAKNSILATCKDDKETISQVEAAYDRLLMRSLTQRRAGKVVSSSVRYADVKAANSPGMGSMPRWLQASLKKLPFSIETPTRGDLGLRAGVYGALIILTYATGTSTSTLEPYAGADASGLILAGSFGASLYFLTKKNVKLGKATIITIGGLVAGAAVGSAVENWLHVDIVPFLGLHSPAAVVSEFILISQFLVSLYLR